MSLFIPVESNCGCSDVVTCVGIFVRSSNDNDVLGTDEARLGGPELQTISMRGGAVTLTQRNRHLNNF